ncbi:ATPase AAA [Candidatus Magnetomorum sp. HK-1]|nr:ATPase AAA [Candidatus Magnetomorum sp. HK-1]
MIRSYYNLNRMPFQKNINPKEIFQTESGIELRKRFEHMKLNRGIMLITGNPGTGKTVHTRAFVDNINENQYKPFYLALSTVTVIEFYRQLCVYICNESYWKKTQLFSAIQQNIKNYVSNNKIVPVIILDECHLLKNEIFYELQLILNFEMDSVTPCILILIGQPHLRNRLLAPAFESFNQRITLKYHFSGFSKKETHLYINHHLQLSGRKVPIFNANALNAIHQNTNGVARVINKLVLKTMMIGALEGKKVLSEEEVYRASKEL